MASTPAMLALQTETSIFRYKKSFGFLPKDGDGSRPLSCQGVPKTSYVRIARTQPQDKGQSNLARSRALFRSQLGPNYRAPSGPPLSNGYCQVQNCLGKPSIPLHLFGLQLNGLRLHFVFLRPVGRIYSSPMVTATPAATPKVKPPPPFFIHKGKQWTEIFAACNERAIRFTHARAVQQEIQIHRPNGE